MSKFRLQRREINKSIVVITPYDLDASNINAAINAGVVKRIDTCCTPDDIVTFEHRLADIKYQIGIGYIPTRRTAAWLWSGRMLPCRHEAIKVSRNVRLGRAEGWNLLNSLSPSFSVVKVESMTVLSPVSAAISLLLIPIEEITNGDIASLGGILESGLVTPDQIKKEVSRFSKREQLQIRVTWNNCLQHMGDMLFNSREKMARVLEQLDQKQIVKNQNQRKAVVDDLRIKLDKTEAEYLAKALLVSNLKEEFSKAMETSREIEAYSETAENHFVVTGSGVALNNLEHQQKLMEKIREGERFRYRALLAEERGRAMLNLPDLQKVEEIVSRLKRNLGNLRENFIALKDEIIAEHALEGHDCRCFDLDHLLELINKYYSVPCPCCGTHISQTTD